MLIPGPTALRSSARSRPSSGVWGRGCSARLSSPSCSQVPPGPRGCARPARSVASRQYAWRHATGFTEAEITELCARIEARELSPKMRRWPPVLGLRNALTVTLTYLRRNRVQAEIAENYSVSQPTISRAISAITPLLVQALCETVGSGQLRYGSITGGREPGRRGAA